MSAGPSPRRGPADRPDLRRRLRGVEEAGARAQMRVFRACPASATIGLLGGLPRVTVPQTCQIPWSQGKTQGISPIQLLFTKNCPENNYKFSSLRANSLRDNAGNYFARAGNFFRPFDPSREFGAKPIRSPRHIRLCQSASVSDEKIINGIFLFLWRRGAVPCGSIQGAPAPRFGGGVRN